MPVRLRFPVRHAALWLLILVVAACLPARPATAQPRGELVVFAAASLKTALDEIDAQYRKEKGTGVRTSYAASSALARQIESGAPADIFISADLDWMDYLAARKQIRAETRSNLLGNQLVLVAPSGSATTLEIGPGFPLAAALGADGRLAMADPDAVPAGKYGRAALEALGVWPTVRERVARAENVRAALLLVARGEAPLGIVYRTDATAEPGVRIVGAFPAGTHPPIVYPIAVTAGSAHADAAGYVAYLKSPAARAAFEKQGFAPLE
jgi:molybdate transport system substrate-binding protein